MKKGKVLIIEDEEAIRILLKDILEDEGYEVFTAENGLQGIEYLKKDIPDVILLDCQMPKMDGYETIKTIRNNPYWANIPVIFLTVKSTENDQIKGIELGADDYMVKPFNRKILIAKMNILLKRKQLDLNINPLTKLPGNIMIQKEVETRLLKDIPFVLLYIDLANFKAYNDYYGFFKGDEVIKHTAQILVKTVEEYDKERSFVGHIGGDDFVVVTTVEAYKQITEQIIEKFDSTIKNFYNEEDIKKGFITTKNRQGEIQNFPIMTISIAAISSQKTKVIHYAELSQRAAELKKYAKKFNKSIFVEERRTE
ncbi:MAG: response regulator [Endomicrobiia bacterium]